MTDTRDVPPTAEAMERARRVVSEAEPYSIDDSDDRVSTAVAREIDAAVMAERERCANLAEDPPVLAFGPVNEPQRSAMEKLTSDEFDALIATWGEFVAGAIMQDDPVLRRDLPAPPRTHETESRPSQSGVCAICYHEISPEPGLCAICAERSTEPDPTTGKA